MNFTFLLVNGKSKVTAASAAGSAGTSFTSGAAGMDAWKLCTLANGALPLSPGSAVLPAVVKSGPPLALSPSLMCYVNSTPVSCV